MPTFGSLFAGIGGIDLGLERAGWTGRWQVEYDPFCSRVLEKHWPDVTRYGDITTVDWSGVERVDLIAGGFPCQPFSLAGQRKGKDDSRWLWPSFADAIRALRPGLVLVENVPGLLAGHGGMGAVLGDLAELGYDTEWDSVPAAAVGAPHLRYRVWIVAHSHDLGGQRVTGLFDSFRAAFGYDVDRRDRAVPDSGGIEHEGGPSAVGGTAASLLLEDADGGAVEPRGRGRRASEADQPLADSARHRRDDGADDHRLSSNGWGIALPPSARGGGGFDAAGWWRVEPDVGRVAHGVPSRVDRLRSLGNAVVPQVVEVIGRQLLASMEAVA